MHMDSCHICGGPVIHRYLSSLVCQNCYSISVRRVPSPEELSEFYNSYNQTYSGGGRQQGRENRQLRYAQRYLHAVRRWRTCGSLIDIGSSLNPFPVLAAGSHYEVTVADYIRPKNLTPEIRFVRETLDDENMAQRIGRSFDIVTSFAVMEHCRFPLIAARNMAHLTASNGIIILMTPLLDAPLEKHAAGISGWFYPPEHLHVISKAGMVSLFEKVDFHLKHFERFELNWPRRMARIALGAAEGCLGLALKAAHPSTFDKLCNSRKTLCKEMALYVFERKPLTAHRVSSDSPA